MLLLIVAGIIISTAGCIEKPEQKIEMVSNVSKIEIVSVIEMGFLDGHIILPLNKTVEFSGKYDEVGPNRSSIDIFIIQDNNTVKWNHLFLDKELDILPGEYVSIKGKVLKNDVYGYAQLIKVDNWEISDVTVNQETIDKCRNSIRLNSKNLSKESLSEVAKWKKESLKDYVLDEKYFFNINLAQSFIDFNNQKNIVSFEGARIPPLNDILYRRVYVYCIFDMKNENTEKLILTIQGETQE